jgi:hypothetical protein
MPSTIPEQYRAVDPFASYNSNTVNQLTEMRSRAENVLDIPCGLDVVADATSTSTVNVKPGYVFKDDMMIYVSEEHDVDFLDFTNQYVSFLSASLAIGYYYIVLEYTYIKSRPAPQAKIKIVMPDQRNFYDYGNSSTSLVFLKAVNITSVTPMTVGSVSDYDPTGGFEDNKREYAKNYAGSETGLPTHEQCRDQGRFAYDTISDQFYFGFEDRWEPLNIAGTFNIDTENVTVGDLCYVNPSGEAQEAITTSIDTAAEMVAVEIGTAALGTGQARLNGYVQDVNVEAGSPAIAVGDLLYLSDSEAGTVTKDQTSTLYQVVGRALTVESALKVDILFFPRAVIDLGTARRLTATLSSGAWSGGGPYYQDIDISGMGLTDRDVVVSLRDVVDHFVIIPEDVDLTGDGGADTIRIWMPTQHATNLVVTVVG